MVDIDVILQQPFSKRQRFSKSSAPTCTGKGKGYQPRWSPLGKGRRCRSTNTSTATCSTVAMAPDTTTSWPPMVPGPHSEPTVQPVAHLRAYTERATRATARRVSSSRGQEIGTARTMASAPRARPSDKPTITYSSQFRRRLTSVARASSPRNCRQYKWKMWPVLTSKRSPNTSRQRC